VSKNKFLFFTCFLNFFLYICNYKTELPPVKKTKVVKPKPFNQVGVEAEKLKGFFILNFYVRN